MGHTIPRASGAALGRYLASKGALLKAPLARLLAAAFSAPPRPPPRRCGERVDTLNDRLRFMPHLGAKGL